MRTKTFTAISVCLSLAVSLLGTHAIGTAHAMGTGHPPPKALPKCLHYERYQGIYIYDKGPCDGFTDDTQFGGGGTYDQGSGADNRDHAYCEANLSAAQRRCATIRDPREKGVCHAEALGELTKCILEANGIQ